MSPTTALDRATPTLLYGILAVWLLITLVIGATGVLANAPVPPPALAIILAALLLLAIRLSPTLRANVQGLGLKTLVGLHLIRILAGANFLRLASQGVLPDEFALFAGWGDIAVGLGALLVLWKGLPVITAAQRTGLLVWNVLGLLDILSVLGNGARLLVGDPTLGAPFAALPLILLPLFVVPLVIASHILIFMRIQKGLGETA